MRVDLLRCALQKCLKVVTSSNSLAESLHISLLKDRLIRYEYDDLGTALYALEIAVPRTFEFSDLRLWSSPNQLYMAYNLHGIVHYFFNFPPTPSVYQDVAQALAVHLDRCFEEEDIRSPAGQVFICDTIIPHMLFTLDVLQSTEAVEDIALIKICKLIKVWPDLSGSAYKSKLEFLKSRVKLVKPVFRPSLANLFPTPQAEYVSSGLHHMWEVEELTSSGDLTHILLEDHDQLAPVQIRDDGGGSSSDEYSGTETSGSESDADTGSEYED